MGLTAILKHAGRRESYGSNCEIAFGGGQPRETLREAVVAGAARPDRAESRLGSLPARFTLPFIPSKLSALPAACGKLLLAKVAEIRCFC